MGGVFSSHECRAGCGGQRCCTCGDPRNLGCPAPAAGCPFDQGCHFPPEPPCCGNYPPEPECLPRLGFLSTCPQQPSFSGSQCGGSQFSSGYRFSGIGIGNQGFPCSQSSIGRSSNCQCPPKVNSMPICGKDLLQKMFPQQRPCPPQMGSGQMCGGQSMRQICPGQQQTCGGSPSGQKQMCPSQQQTCGGGPSRQMYPGPMCCGQSGMNLPAGGGMQPMCPAMQQGGYEPPMQMMPSICCELQCSAYSDQAYDDEDSVCSEEPEEPEEPPVRCEELPKKQCCGSKRKLYQESRCGSSTIISPMQEVPRHESARQLERQRRMVCRDPSHHGVCSKSKRTPVRRPPQPGCTGAGNSCSSSRSEVRPRRPGKGQPCPKPPSSRPSSGPCSRPSSQPSSCCGSVHKLQAVTGTAPCQRPPKPAQRPSQKPKAKRTPRAPPSPSIRSVEPAPAPEPYEYEYEEEYFDEPEEICEAPPVCRTPCLPRQPPQPRHRPRPLPPPPPPQPAPPPPQPAPPPPEYYNNANNYNNNVKQGPDLYKSSKSKATDFLKMFLVIGGECCKIILQVVFLLRQYLGRMCNEVMTRKKCNSAPRCCGTGC